MKALQELEQRILGIVARNKELESEVTVLRELNDELVQKVTQLESSLLRESNTSAVLHEEKDALRLSLDKLLAQIDTTSSQG